MSDIRVNKWFAGCLNDIKVINNIKRKITNIKEDLTKFEKNPKFYRNKKFIAIAASLAIVATVAILSCFTFSLGAPVFVATVSNFSSPGLVAGGIFAFMTAPLFSLVSLRATLPDAFKSHKRDLKNLAALQAEHKKIEQQLAEKVALKNFKLQHTQEQLQKIADAMLEKL